MQWYKDPKLRYVDLCIYIDANIPKIATSRDYPEIENTVYNYLWLLVKALAIKKRMFPKRFEDYDGYAFYAAKRLYFALIKNYQNQGKRIKGKEIRPIKSCLNYTKALMYPMKLEYQKETFNEIISEEEVSKQFDAFTYKEHLKEIAYNAQTESQWTAQYIRDVLQSAPRLLEKVLAKSPFKPGTADYKKVRVSILLTCLNSLNTKQQLNWNPQVIYLWRLPKSISGYVRVLLKEFYTELKLEIMDCIKETHVDDRVLETLITNQPEVNNNED